jgi:hypothetical protein
MRVRGTTLCRPAEVFAIDEQPKLKPLPDEVFGVCTKYEADVGALHPLPHGHGQVHTGMDVCELPAVALTAAPLPPPWSLRRAHASTSPRLA